MKKNRKPILNAECPYCGEPVSLPERVSIAVTDCPSCGNTLKVSRQEAIAIVAEPYDVEDA